MQKPASTQQNLLYIDTLRGLAAIYVMLHHAVLQYYDFNVFDLTGIKKAGISAFFFGQFAVNLFIVLSGFCLMRPVIYNNLQLKGGNWLFYKRRIIRILPPYYLAMTLSAILIVFLVGQKTGTHWDISIPITFNGLLTHLLLIHDFFINEIYQINHSFWSVSVECRIYILFPVLIYLWRKTGPFVTILVALAGSYAGYLVLGYAHQYYSNIDVPSPGVSPYIVLFCMGMFAAEITDSSNRRGIKGKYLLGGLLLFLSVNVFFVARKLVATTHADADSFVYQWIPIAFGLCCCCALIFCSSIHTNSSGSVKWLKNALSWQPLVFFGSFAYSIYLIHAPILQVLSQYIIAPLHLSRYNSALLLLALSLVVIIPLAYLFFICCERPFMKLGKKKSVAQVEQAAIASPAP